MQPDRLLTITEACQRLSISRSRLYELLAESRIQARKSGTRTVVPESEVQRFIEALPPAKIGKAAKRAA